MIRSTIKQFLIIIFIHLFTKQCFSQIDSTKNFQLYTSPLQSINIFAGCIPTLGCEYIAFNKIGICGEIGYKLTDFIKSDSIIVPSFGITGRIELKYYDVAVKKNRFVRDYLSLEYRYIKNHYNQNITYVIDSSYSTPSSDVFGIKKEINIGNIKYGTLICIGKIMYLDVYSGFGIRYRNIQNVGRSYNPNLGHRFYYPENLGFIGVFEEDDPGLNFNFTIGIKVGIRL